MINGTTPMGRDLRCGAAAGEENGWRQQRHQVHPMRLDLADAVVQRIYNLFEF